MDLPFPPERRARVIVNTDAKNEADDQFAIVRALLTPSFEIAGVIPAHFGTLCRRCSTSPARPRCVHVRGRPGCASDGRRPSGLVVRDRLPGTTHQ